MDDGFEPVTGFLFRQTRGLFFGFGQRWCRVKFVFDGAELRSFSDCSSSHQQERWSLDDIDEVMPVLLVPRKAPVVPPGARAEAPCSREAGSAQALTSGLVISLTNGAELLLCADDDADRDRWVRGLNLGLRRVPCQRPPVEEKPIDQAPTILADRATPASPRVATPAQSAKTIVTQAPIALPTKGIGKSKAAPPPSKGKAPPVPKGKGKGKPVQPTANAKTKAAPKFYGFAEKRLQATEAESTVFRPAGKGNVCFNAFVGQERSGAERPQGVGGKKGKALFDDKTAQRLGVATHRLDVAGLATVADSLDFQSRCKSFRGGVEGAELLCDLLTELESSAPLQKVRQFIDEGGDASQLREIERRLVPLARVPRALQRIQLLIASTTLADRVAESQRQIEATFVAATAVQASPHLRDVVHAVQEFLAWNSGGGAPESLVAFHVGDQLERLNSIKPPGSSEKAKLITGYSMVHWTAETLLHWGRNLPPDPLMSDVPNLPQASKLSPTLLQSDLAWVRSCTRQARDELQNHRESYAKRVLVEPPTPDVLDEPAAAETTEAETPAGAGTTEGENLARDSSEESTRAPSSTEFYSLDDEQCERRRGPTLWHRDQLLGTSSTSGWDPAKMPTVAAHRLKLHPAGAFAYLVPSCIASQDTVQARPSVCFGRASVFRRQGFVWVLQPRRLRRPTWRKCWADIRSGHLVLRQLRGQRVTFESAVPLPGSEAVLFESLFATGLSRWLFSLGVHGVQLTAAGMEAPVIIRVDSAAAASTWHEVLNQESDRPGLSRLLHQHGDRWQPLWCALDVDERIFSGYAELLDHVFGRSPTLSIDLRSACVRACHESALRGAPAAFGFELEELQSGVQWSGPSRVATFCVHSPDVLRKWLDMLQAAPLQIRWGEDGRSSFVMGRPSELLRAPQSWSDSRPSFGLAFVKPDASPADVVDDQRDCVEEADETAMAIAAPEPAVAPPPRGSAIGPRHSMAAKAVVTAEIVTPSPPASDGQAACEDSVSSGSESDDASDGDEQDGNSEDHGERRSAERRPAANLRRLARELRVGEKALVRDVEAAQCAAQAALAFFDENTPTSKSLDALHVFLGQLMVFGRDFKVALARVRQEQAKLKVHTAAAASTKAKAKSKVAAAKVVRKCSGRFNTIELQASWTKQATADDEGTQRVEEDCVSKDERND